MKTLIRHHFTEFGLLVGAIVSLTAAIIASAWEWMDNPSGIFRDSEGTNWQFVFDTASSWLEPTFVYTVVLMSLGHLVWVCLKWLIGKLSGNEKQGH